MSATAAVAPVFAKEVKPLKAMGLLQSVVLFGVPALALFASMNWLWPALMNAGMERPVAYTISLGLVNAGLIFAAVAGYRLEGNPFTWNAFSSRMRLAAITGRTWLWVVGAILVFGIGALLINSLAVVVYKALNFTMPDITPGSTTILMQIVTLALNIFGEELWWRGYIMPRQELVFGKRTWLVHGTLWACFHMFKWWTVPFMLITCQVIPFVAQRTKNTWPGIINHLVVNGVGMILPYL
jgi:membrane protease YdiL (CAAX protease family)